MWDFPLLVATVTVATLSVPRPANAACRPVPGLKVARAEPNDNRRAAGSMKDGVVTLRLVMREATWFPDGPGGCALRVHAFAEEGKPAQIPGPLIRIRTGTEVRVVIRNALPRAVWIRGMQSRPVSVLDSTEVPAGATRDFAFRGGDVGAWYYWAGRVDARVPLSNDDGQLIGALIVDSAAPPRDRVFVMSRWTPDGSSFNRGYQLNAINGRSWPFTERLQYTAGDSVRWHVINASDAVHTMHLHGFYYRIDARGDAVHDSTLARARPVTVVTAGTRPGEWVSLAWTPERTGNWLFHCHFVTHMSAEQRLDRTPVAGNDIVSSSHAPDALSRPGVSDHARESMAGLVLGVTVRPALTAASAAAALPAPAARSIQLFADERPRVYGARSGFGFVEQGDSRLPASDSLAAPGTPLILTRGEPVRIIVRNRLMTPLAVHWHGIELESYFDGVGGWSGAGRSIAPMIPPSQSFEARFTPPRAGTFMYHVHNEHGDELASGLYAPLLVLEPGQAFDRIHDRAFIIGTPGPGVARGDSVAAYINGTATPDTLDWVVGSSYRLRLLDISANDIHVISLTGPSGLQQWLAIARDGRDLQPPLRAMVAAREVTASGVTRDFGFTPQAPGDYSLAVTTLLSNKLTNLVTSVPIRVRAP